MAVTQAGDELAGLAGLGRQQWEWPGPRHLKVEPIGSAGVGREEEKHQDDAAFWPEQS